jgi:death-on-curing protein
MQTGYGVMLYPTLVGRSAALLHGVASAHAFEDGNKRTAWLCTAMYLERDGLPLRRIPDLEAADFVVDVVLGRMSLHEVSLWLLDRT